MQPFIVRLIEVVLLQGGSPRISLFGPLEEKIAFTLVQILGRFCFTLRWRADLCQRVLDLVSKHVFVDIESFEALNFAVNDLGDSIGHYEVVLLPDSSHSLALLSHFGLLVVQINLDHVQLIVARLHDAGLVESHPFENDGELED